ncbi:uncharacterized protein LOC130629884 [Hydractinia symbiolongicarpus]|uniref:uncharacterized protein LOC130629884 n=1 Tax=Hydractinia symbiolongicarpus TaxID=13093 RepID=UPI00254CA77A|nr:uncharacterized protein LOC130629884 [Hydractinia symbiolongicarpus]
MILVRIRCGLLLEDMAVRFNMSTSHISRILITWTDFLHSQFRMLPIWASKETVQNRMPKCFQKSYPNTRVILDCTEVFVEMPTSYRTQSSTFSNYKHHNTAKGLVGIAPDGSVTFVSDLYGGRFSDKRITKDSGIYDLLEPGDSVMADRGFELEEDLPDGVTLNIPPFLDGKPQLSLLEENETRRIASVRVHVERAIERIKNYRILQTVFKLSMAAELNKIWVICCHLDTYIVIVIEEGDTFDVDVLLDTQFGFSSMGFFSIEHILEIASLHPKRKVLILQLFPLRREIINAKALAGFRSSE